MKRLLSWMLALALALLPSGGAAEEKPRRLTLMIYMCGSNLESAYGSATSDILEMLEAGGAGDGVSVLLMTGGTSRWSLGLDAQQCQIHELGPRGMRTVWHSEALDMGSSETLTRLLRYGRENRPAEDYALILWDHGGDPMEGLCWDELFSLDNLSLEELRQGIEDAGLGRRLSWIGLWCTAGQNGSLGLIGQTK